MDSHTAAAIAQLVFYIPAIPVAFYLCVRNWKRGPRMACYPAVPFTNIRLVGAILVIVEEQNQTNTSLIAATLVLLNLGLVPLVLNYLGFVRQVFRSSLKDSKGAKRFSFVVHLFILGAVALLSTSGALAGQPDRANTQSRVAKVAYIEFTGIFLALVGMTSVLYFKQSKVKDSDRIYLKWMLIASVFLAVRIVYGLLGVFEPKGDFTQVLRSQWNPLFGSAVAFSLMALLPEYLALCCYFKLGFHRLRTYRREDLEEAAPEVRLHSR
ncbi:hypothetical protein B0T26DRAFT_745134 [Lasiosphaeria miniovina]|uniref:DUF7702 domain-containing protein n=1 Tax=Lasiosphaeria miniovina TaxID=1954250 RepID=A0AA40EF64_9PEZI|nr:uncharacterized protein B0T26DRAFT_745134 [Lasiosphaeria miniovina]KAK0733038.1 hypothetical protein B0T26DRAFT_745134 [Lasiosphaeria miniovina]